MANRKRVAKAVRDRVSGENIAAMSIDAAQPSGRAGAENRVDAAPVAGWHATAGALLLLSAAILGFYWEAAVGAVRVWWASPSFNHGFLIIPISAFLFWERRSLLTGVAPQPWLPAVILLPMLGLAWIITYKLTFLEGQQFLVIAMLQIAFLAVLGRDIYRRLLFPLLFLFFMVPTGEFLIPALQDFTARFVVLGLRLTGVPVFSDGFLISVPNGDYYVAEACAGLRFLIATIAFGVLFADFALRSLFRRAVFIILCLIIPVFANGVRAYGIVLLGYLTSGRLAQGVDHVLYGWLFFSLVTLGLFAVGWALRDRIPAPPAPAPRRTKSSRGRTALVTVLVLFVVALPRGFAAWMDNTASAGSDIRLSLPVPPGWEEEAGKIDWQPAFAGADATLLKRYRSGSREIDTYIAYYRSQGQDKKLISVQNRITGSDDWQISDRSAATMKIGDEPVGVAATRLSWGKRRRLVWSFYWIDDRFEANGIMAKLLQIKAELWERKPEAAFVALSAEETDDVGTAQKAVSEFAAHVTGLKPALREAARR
jgi:exosortase A